MQDQQIIALLQKRDEKALLEIRQAYGGLCFQTAYRILGSREDAEECVSDMLIGVWNSIPPDTQSSVPYFSRSRYRFAKAASFSIARTLFAAAAAAARSAGTGL